MSICLRGVEVRSCELRNFRGEMETNHQLPIPVYGDICMRKKNRRKRQKKLLVLLFLDFAKNTTLHGLRYITEAGLYVIEKVFWGVTFLTSVSICFFFIFNVWRKWQDSPVIVSFSAKHVSVDEVPFPSVTICPQVKFLQSKFNYSEVLQLYFDGKLDILNNSEKIETANTISMLCDVPRDIGNISRNLNASAIHTLYNISVNSDDILPLCFLGTHSCTFKRVLTRDGICFNFNGLMAEEIFNMDVVQKEFSYTLATNKIKNWTLDNGYETTSYEHVYPYRGRASNVNPYLDLLLTDLDPMKDSRCTALYGGYKIYLHHPADLPQAGLYHFDAIPMQLTSMGIKFTMETARSDLEKYPVPIRQCYFPKEKPLLFFRIYTYNNCILECLTNATYKLCGCVVFYMPYNDSSKICSPKNTYCASQAEALFTSSKDAHLEKCDCLPACNSIEYDSEIHKSEYKLEDFFRAYSGSTGFENYSIKDSRVTIFYKQPTFRTVHRSELYGLTDFLGSCGGLLGLFLGFSWLSLVEIFYFLTFRVYKTIKADLKNEKAEPSKKA